MGTETYISLGNWTTIKELENRLLCHLALGIPGGGRGGSPTVSGEKQKAPHPRSEDPVYLTPRLAQGGG
jgi:hypothetical protein